MPVSPVIIAVGAGNCDGPALVVPPPLFGNGAPVRRDSATYPMASAIDPSIAFRIMALLWFDPQGRLRTRAKPTGNALDSYGVS